MATLLSIAGTVVPSALVLASLGEGGNAAVIELGLVGMELGPSLGHWYAGDYLTGGLAMRAGGSVLMVVGLAQSFDCYGSDESSCRSAGVTPALVGAALFVTGTAYDIVTAGRAANRWNANHVQLAPTMIASAGHTTMGVGLGGTF